MKKTFVHFWLIDLHGDNSYLIEFKTLKSMRLFIKSFIKSMILQMYGLAFKIT